MSADDRSGSRKGKQVPNRRSILVGGSTLAASALAASAPVRTAQAQPQPQRAASPAAGKPNILVIFGDDIGIA